MLKDIAFICPTEIELKPLRPILKKLQIPYYICGVGQVFSCFFLTKLLSSQPYKVIILAGIGGLYDKFEKDFDKLFLAKTEILADFARCSTNEIESISIPQLNIERVFHLEKSLNTYLSRSLKYFLPVNMATVSCSSGDIKRARLIQKTYNVVVENMEGASIAYVCKKFKVGLIELRSISNIAGENNKALWQVDKALKRLTEGVELLLTNLQNG